MRFRYMKELIQEVYFEYYIKQGENMINILANSYLIDADWCFSEFHKYIEATHKVVIVPFSFRNEDVYSNETWQSLYSKDEGPYYHGIVDSFKRYNIRPNNIKWINYFTDDKTTAEDKILEADIIYLTGGLPDLMMERLREFSLIKIIEEHKGVIIGFSAGALIQLNQYHLTPDEDYNEFKYYPGLNMINNLYVEVHFDHDKVQMDSINRVNKETNKPVYAIEEDGAIIHINNKIVEVGKVHYFGVSNM